MRKVLTAGLVTLFAISLTACSKSDTASPEVSASAGSWTQEQKGFLQTIYASNMAANDVISEDVYVGMGDTVCQGLTQGTKTEALLALLAVTAEKNGLPQRDRAVFGPTIAAAAVTYLCPENINNLVVK